MIGLARIFILDEKTSQINIVMQQFTGNSKYPVYHHVELIAAPMPTLMVNSILLSPDSILLALITRVSVYVLDVNPRFLPEDSSQAAVIRPIYCAFDTTEIAGSSGDLPELVQVRWHPRQHNLLVLLTTNSTIVFIHCSKQPSTSSTGSLSCKIRFLLDVNAFYKQLEWKSGNVVQNGDDDYEIFDDTVRSDHRRLNFEDALGFNCVDFDFGSPLLLHSECSFAENQKIPDFSLYLLCETGDVILVSGCFGDSNSTASSKVKYQVLHILPPTADNYGDDFCSLRCISSLLAFCAPGPMTNEVMPPDVLVMANRSGRLFHGIVLHSVGQTTTRGGASLCLIELVDLQLSGKSPILDPGSVSDVADLVIEAPCALANPYQSWLTSGSSMCQPAGRVGSAAGGLASGLVSDANFLEEAVGYGQQQHHYYVAHPTGLHLIRMPWLAQLSSLCQRLRRDSQAECLADLRLGRSTVRHLVCSQLPVAVGTHSATANDGDFRVAGLIETTPLSSETNPSRFGRTVTALLIVRAPLEPITPVESGNRPSDINPLVLSIHLEVTTSENATVSNAGGVTSSREVGNLRPLSSNQDTRPSEFSVHLHRLLGGDNVHLPMLSSSFATLPDRVTDKQLIQLFVEMIGMLREGPLKRLMAARGFVEQYYSRLDDLLVIQSKKANELGEYRTGLQTEALKLAAQHAVILDRQEMLEKRLTDVANHLANLAAAPSKAEVAMEDEVNRWKARLESSLRKWMTSLKDRCATAAADRTKPNAKKISASPALPTKTVRESVHTPENWTNVSVLIKRETVEIKSLIQDVKRLNSLCENVV